MHDCAGLIKGYLWSNTPDSVPKYSASQDLSAGQFLATATRSGDISTIPEMPGLLVFFTGHVGVYIGNGKVIEARGFDYGVVETEMKDRPWKKWGKCPFIEYSAGASGADISLEKGTEVKKVNLVFDELKTGSSGDQVRTVQRLLRSMGYKGADGKAQLLLDGVFGKNTASAVRNFQKQNRLVADGIVGEKTWAALTGGVAM